MSVTNGYDLAVVLPAMRRLGFRNPTEAGYNIVDNTQSASTSGRYYNDDSFHTSLTVQNIYDCQPDENISDATFNTYLGQLKDAVILSTLGAVFNEPQVIEAGLLYKKQENVGRVLITSRGKFCGVRFVPADGEYGISLKNAIMLFDRDVAFTLYLFNEFIDGSDSKYIKSWEITAKANRQVSVPLNYDFSYLNTLTKGGTWFLGYFQNDLGDARAVSFSPCRNIYSTFNALSFQACVIGGDDFDRNIYSFTSDMFGLNVEISAYADVTNKILLNARLFDNLQGLIMAAKVVELIYNTTRSNITERISKENIGILYRELNNVTTMENPSESGLKRQIQKEVAKLKKGLFGCNTVMNVDL